MASDSSPTPRAGGLLPYQLEEEPERTGVTSFAGLPLVAETYRATGASAAVRAHVRTGKRERKRGLTDEELVESVCLLLAAGGECVDDIEALKADEGLEAMLGYTLSSPTRVKEFLYAFHDDDKDSEHAQQRQLVPSFVPEENEPLSGLYEANQTLAHLLNAQSPVKQATLDVDATIVTSEKKEAAYTHKGDKGCQPQLVYWVEQDVIVADEFRDGNVPAGTDLLRVLKRGVSALPGGIDRISVRIDSAGYEHEVLNWCREDVAGRPPITFAISADMSQELRGVIQALPETAWQKMDEGARCVRSWAEVEFVPSKGSTKKGRRPDRYLAIRIQHRQRTLFADGSDVKHFAVVTNDWDRDGAELIRWHRGKAGTIELVNDVLKNDLGAGVMPCGRFGANAAWFRLNVLTYNLLSALKATALPVRLNRARPKRLRLWVLGVGGRLIHHARQLIVRVRTCLRTGRALLVRARQRLQALAVETQARAAPT